MVRVPPFIFGRLHFGNIPTAGRLCFYFAKCFRLCFFLISVFLDFLFGPFDEVLIIVPSVFVSFTESALALPCLRNIFPSAGLWLVPDAAGSPLAGMGLCRRSDMAPNRAGRCDHEKGTPRRAKGPAPGQASIIWAQAAARDPYDRGAVRARRGPRRGLEGGPWTGHAP